jgi:hypothetical protein
LNTEKGLVAAFEVDGILLFNSVVCCDEESLAGLTSIKLFLLLVEILLVNFSYSFRVRSSFILTVSLFSIFSFDGQESRILLVPESFDWDTVFANSELHEFIHVDIIDIEFGIGNSYFKRLLISQDSKFFAVSVETDVFDFS